MTFNGFISYSHAADGRLAPAVQRGLHRLAKPWHRRRALWIFRDQTGLSVTPKLWSSIQTALDGSDYFVLLASPEAARSQWVNREIEHWISTKPVDKILPVVTDGEWEWDPQAHDFTEESTAVPAALRGAFSEEPLFLDLRWARGSEHLSLQHSRFRDAIAQLAAPMHGVSKDELEGEDVRQHRRARRMWSGVAATLAVLTLVATFTGVSAVRNAERARNAAAEALQQRLVAEQQRGSAERFAEESLRQQELARQQQARAAAAAAEADRQERLAREQRKAADQAAAEARRQQRLADQAAKRTREQQQRTREQEQRAREQQRLAEEAAERAKQLQKEAQRLAKAAAEQERLAREARREAERQQAIADEQQRIAVSRRLINQARATAPSDPKMALMLGTAAQSLRPDAEIRSELTGVVTGTNYAGTLPDVTWAEYGPDGVLAALGRDGRVSFWNVSDAAHPVRISTLPEQGAAGDDVTFSPDGRTLAVVGATGTAVLWDVAVRTRPARLVTMTVDGAVRAAAFSGDGRTLALAHGAAVTLWNLADRARPAQLARMTDRAPYGVVALAFSRDGRRLVADKDGYTLVYDLTEPTRPMLLTGLGTGFVAVSMEFDPNAHLLAVGGNMGTVSFHDMASTAGATPARNDPPPTGPVPPVPPGGFPDPPMKPVALADPVPPPLPSFPPDDEEDGGVVPPPLPSFPPDDEEDGDAVPPPLPTDTDEDETAPVPPPLPPLPPDDEDVVTPPPMPTDDPDPADTSTPPLTGLAGDVGAVAFSRDGRALAAGDAGGTVLVWHDRKLTASLRARGAIFGLDFDPSGQTLVTRDSSGTATLWQVAPRGAPEQLAALAFPSGGRRAAAFRPGGDSLLAAGAGGAARFWKVTDPARPGPATDLAIHDGTVSAAAFSPDNRTVAAAGTRDGKLTLTDVTRPARPVRLTTVAGVASGPFTMAFSPDGRTLAIAGTTTLQLWNVADRSRPTLLAVRNSENGDFGSKIAFSPDGRTLATGTGSVVTLWNVADRVAPVRLAELAGHLSLVTTVAFSRDGHTLVSGSRDATAVLWDVTNRAEPLRVATLTGHGAAVESLTFGPDGHTLAAGSADSSVHLWDTANPIAPVRVLWMLTGPDGGTPEVAFRDDGRILAVTGQPYRGGATVKLWNYTRLNKLRANPAAYACAITGRGLSAGEWARFVPELPYRRTCTG
jgi:WD40 repeat protein